MTAVSSTFRASLEPTVGDVRGGRAPSTILEQVAAEWAEAGRPDLVASIWRHPQLLHDRSLLLNLALDEYRALHAGSVQLDLNDHCQRFRGFGGSIERSILRQLETQQYIDDHPDLLGLLREPQWPEIGEQLGKFQVLEELGRGASARVYLCRQGDIGNRQVVVKATPFADYEAAILGRLNHPNIIPIHSAGVMEDRRLNYLCMPFRGRCTLTELLDHAFDAGLNRGERVIIEAANCWKSGGDETGGHGRRAFHWPIHRDYVSGVLKLGIQIADALEHAHAQGILHGDLKPSNVLLTPAGEPLILDFNLSRDYTNVAGLCGGTLPYMPPEYVRHVADQHTTHELPPTFTPRPDIYSFGALMYELLAGVPPVALPQRGDDTADLAAQVLSRLRNGVPSIRCRNPLVRRSLEHTILRCLSFDPDDRPATMSAVKQGLREEMGVLPSLVRAARARPRGFAGMAAVIMAASLTAGAYVATRPPEYLAQYQRGSEFFAAGAFDQAVDSFLASASANPSFAPARFDLARAHLAMGELDLAGDVYARLAREQNDVPSMAYAGYILNLKGIPRAAIVWYQQAISAGAESAAVYNNLGASQLVAWSPLPLADKLQQAREHLDRALEMEPSSLAVRFNLLRWELIEAGREHSYCPIDAWPHVRALLASEPVEPVVRTHIAQWYAILHRRERHLGAGGIKSVLAPSDVAELERLAILPPPVELTHPDPRPAEPPATESRSAVGVSTPVRSAENKPATLPRTLYYLEPVSLLTLQSD